MDIWIERNLPGYSRPPYPVSAWENFTLDPGWSGDLRVRLIFGERVAQFKGVIAGGPPGESPTRLGILEPGFRPVRAYGFVVGGRRSGWSNLVIRGDGTVLLSPGIAQGLSLHVVYPLD